MDRKTSPNFQPYVLASVVVFILLGGALIYAFMRIGELTARVDILANQLEITTDQFSENTTIIAKNVTDLNKQTLGISDILSTAQQKIEAVKNKVGGVEQTVGTLQKLSEVDPEILKKYSKIYFMNENYKPANLTIIPKEYTYTEARTEQFLTEAWPHLKNLLDDAKSSGVQLYIKSSYRSFGEQKSLKSTYSVIYGAGTANTFSADQGYSEHQLGTTIDLITTGLGGQLSGFDRTPAFTWLEGNAHRYGFILSYPKGNAYYIYEPWHWRYVGVKLATYLHATNKNFYDLDQREIDKYLINAFD